MGSSPNASAANTEDAVAASVKSAAPAAATIETVERRDGENAAPGVAALRRISLLKSKRSQDLSSGIFEKIRQDLGTAYEFRYGNKDQLGQPGVNKIAVIRYALDPEFHNLSDSQFDSIPQEFSLFIVTAIQSTFKHRLAMDRSHDTFEIKSGPSDPIQMTIAGLTLKNATEDWRGDLDVVWNNTIKASRSTAKGLIVTLEYKNRIMQGVITSLTVTEQAGDALVPINMVFITYDAVGFYGGTKPSFPSLQVGAEVELERSNRAYFLVRARQQISRLTTVEVKSGSETEKGSTEFEAEDHSHFWNFILVNASRSEEVPFSIAQKFDRDVIRVGADAPAVYTLNMMLTDYDYEAAGTGSDWVRQFIWLFFNDFHPKKLLDNYSKLVFHWNGRVVAGFITAVTIAEVVTVNQPFPQWLAAANVQFLSPYPPLKLPRPIGSTILREV